MRIRKRQVPFPLSSLSPVPLSDPLLNLNSPSPVVQLHHYDSSPPIPSNPSQPGHGLAHVHPRPSDRPNQHISPIGSRNNGWDGSDAGGEHKEKKKKKEENCLELLLEAGVDVDDDDDERGTEEMSNDIRKESILGAKAVSGHAHQQSSCSSQAFGRWCEGEKVFPLKKRRGSFERGTNGEKDKKAVRGAKMKTKMNKKCARKNAVAVVVDEHEDDGNKESNSSAGSGAKKRGRGGGLMEGSRCSRVNGRGWRCCQQTLVGYSLCEHHLGKGRLRSMTSVRSRSLATTTTTTTASTHHDYSSSPPLTSSSTLLDKDSDAKKPVMLQNDEDTTKADYEEEVEEKKPLTMITKKRMKLGMVKARSMSSLLGQTNSAISLSDNAK